MRLASLFPLFGRGACAGMRLSSAERRRREKSTLANKRPFAQLRDIPAGRDSGADGIAIDSRGRIYVTALTGVQVFNSGGTYLGNIKVPRKPSNVAFSGPGKRVLYITAQEGLYKLPTEARGPDRLGK